MPKNNNTKKSKKKSDALLVTDHSTALDSWLGITANAPTAPQHNRYADYEQTDMVVLDCIAERKTAADLAASIVDGRYREQKFRLQVCDIRTKIYIVEALTLSKASREYHRGVNTKALEKAIVSTQVNVYMIAVLKRYLAWLGCKWYSCAADKGARSHNFLFGFNA